MIGEIVVKATKVKITEVRSARHTIYLRKDFVTDSAFPFQPNQKLIAKIVGKRLIIESEEDGGARDEAVKRGEKP